MSLMVGIIRPRRKKSTVTQVKYFGFVMVVRRTVLKMVVGVAKMTLADI